MLFWQAQMDRKVEVTLSNGARETLIIKGYNPQGVWGTSSRGGVSIFISTSHIIVAKTDNHQK